jgi:hypothetical protein
MKGKAMELEAFRIQNYKKIDDTGWISCNEVTVFVGKNEAGKSAIFRGLSKLNPSDGEQYDPLKEFPRRRYTSEFADRDWPVASGRFALWDSEVQDLSKIHPALATVESVEVTRYYSSQATVGFMPIPDVSPVTSTDAIAAVDVAIRQVQDLTAPEGKGDVLGPVKQAILTALEASKAQFPAGTSIGKANVDHPINAIATQSNEEWQKTLLDPIIDPLRVLSDRALTHEKLATAQTWIVKHLPKFIYFDKYDVLDSAVHIPSFLAQLSSAPNAPRVRTTNCLFRHVGLDTQKLAGLGRHTPGQELSPEIRRQIDERAILASSASTAMTEKFESWWEQRRHKFRYQIDGDYFRIWVSDDLDPSEIELDQRSAGMQYFFSFYLVFLVEAEGAHSNSILLLDEPGLHLHGGAQSKLVSFFNKLAEDNQTLYSTHSPFMVDADHLETARAVFESEDGTTKVSEDVWPRDKDTLFPLQAALGYQLAQALFVSKRQLIVEGLTDYWIIKAFDYALAAKGAPHLRADVILVPSAGVSKLLPLASMLIGHNVEIAALLDGDEPARKEGKKLVNKLLAGQDRKCLFIGDFVSNKTAEVEDIFAPEEYLAAVTQAYPNIGVDFTDSELAIPSIVDRLKVMFARKGEGEFEKWRPDQVLRDQLMSAPSDISDSTFERIGAILAAVNALFEE